MSARPLRESAALAHRRGFRPSKSLRLPAMAPQILLIQRRSKASVAISAYCSIKRQIAHDESLTPRVSAWLCNAAAATHSAWAVGSNLVGPMAASGRAPRAGNEASAGSSKASTIIPRKAVSVNADEPPAAGGHSLKGESPSMPTKISGLDGGHPPRPKCPLDFNFKLRLSPKS